MADTADDNRSRSRIVVYSVVGIALTLAYIALRDLTWTGNTGLHTLMEAVAVILAMIVGVMALVRYYSKPNITILFIGTGFLGTAFLDAYHAIVTAAFFPKYMPSDLPSLMPWSWIASRQLLAIMLLLSWLAWLHEKRLGTEGLITAPVVYVGTATLTIGCFLFFAFTPLPLAYYPDVVFHRPEEFIPAIFFAIALFGYLRKGNWRTDALEHWLVLALIVSLVTHAVVMPFSETLFDLELDSAHLLKIVSYVCVLIGLLISMFDTFRDAEIVTERLQTVLSNAIDGIITIDERGKIESCNLAAERIFGYQAREIMGHNVRVLMPEPDRGKHDTYLNNFVTTGEAKIIGIGREVVGLRKDGERFPMDLGVTEGTLYNTGTRTFIGSIRDITRIKEAERKTAEHASQLEVANAELDAFAYSVSHDLRAPLRAMGGFVQALEEDYGDRLDGDATDYMDRIRKASQRMGQMIDEILALSRTMRVDMIFKRVNLSTMAESIISQLREDEPDRDIALIVSPDVMAYGDKRLLEIVMRNLLLNAWKFSSKKSQTRIEFNSMTKTGESVFFVRDNGVGFNMAYIDKLFGIFQRLHSRTEFEGNGIGLATVARLIGRHGGRVWAESAENEGATFYFTVGTQTKGWSA